MGGVRNGASNRKLSSSSAPCGASASTTYYQLMLRTELAELLVYCFQADGVKLGFETNMSDAALELKHLQFGVASTAAKKWGLG